MKTPLPLFRIAHLLPLLGLSFVSGCGATALNPGAERVMVSHLPPRSDCRFVTTLVGQQGDAIAGKFTSNRDLAEGAMNDMKNQAQTAGANYVLLETTIAGNTMSGGPNYVSGQQTDVTHVGNAFICPNGPASSGVTSPESQASSQ